MLIVKNYLNSPLIIKKIVNNIGIVQKSIDTILEIFSAFVIPKCIERDKFNISYPSSPQIGKDEKVPVNRLDTAKYANGRKFVVLYPNARNADSKKFIIHPPENTASCAVCDNLLVFLLMIMP